MSHVGAKELPQQVQSSDFWLGASSPKRLQMNWAYLRSCRENLNFFQRRQLPAIAFAGDLAKRQSGGHYSLERRLSEIVINPGPGGHLATFESCENGEIRDL